MHQISWQPGEQGKGVVDQDGHVHAWNEEDYELHDDYLEAHPHIGSPQSYFYIDPDGRCLLTMPSIHYDGVAAHDAAMQTITDADPHFHGPGAGAKDTWDF